MGGSGAVYVIWLSQNLPTEIYDCRNRKVGCFHGNNCLNAPSNERANSAAEYSSEKVMNGRKKWAAHGQYYYCCQQLTAKTAGESIQTKVSSVFQRTSSGNHNSYAHVVILSFYIGIFTYQGSDIITNSGFSSEYWSALGCSTAFCRTAVYAKINLSVGAKNA